MRAAAGAQAPTCDDAAHSRIALLVSTLKSIANVDMRGAPYAAKDRIFHALHPVFVPRPKTKKPAGEKPAGSSRRTTLDGRGAGRQHPASFLRP